MALYKSIDGGAYWTTSILRSDPGSIGTALALDPQNPNIVHVGGRGYFYSSFDGGSTWTQKGNLNGTVQALSVDPAASNRIVAGTTSGLYKSEDGGSSWTSKMASDFKTIARNPTAPNEIVAGGTNGVSISKDSGQTWSELNLGLTFKNVTSLQWNEVNKILFAGTDGGSVYAYNATFIPQDIFPPLDFSGTKKLNRGLLHAECLIELSWKANPQNIDIQGYRLFLINGLTWTLLTELGSGTLEYRHRRVDKTKEYRYAIKAFKAGGREGDPAYTKVQ